MFDDFFIRALVAGIGIALVTGPLGCFVVWRRLSYFGDTLAHSALLGVTLAYTFDLNIALSVFIISSIIALILIQLQRKTNLPGDALLGLLAHSSLAVGLVVIGFLTFIKKNQIKTLVLYLILLSIFLELLHLLIPERTFQWSDIFGNLIGVVVVILIRNLIKKYEVFKK